MKINISIIIDPRIIIIMVAMMLINKHIIESAIEYMINNISLDDVVKMLDVIQLVIEIIKLVNG